MADTEANMVHAPMGWVPERTGLTVPVHKEQPMMCGGVSPPTYCDSDHPAPEDVSNLVRNFETLLLLHHKSKTAHDKKVSELHLEIKSYTTHVVRGTFYGFTLKVCHNDATIGELECDMFDGFGGRCHCTYDGCKFALSVQLVPVHHVPDHHDEPGWDHGGVRKQNLRPDLPGHGPHYDEPGWNHGGVQRQLPVKRFVNHGPGPVQPWKNAPPRQEIYVEKITGMLFKFYVSVRKEALPEPDEKAKMEEYLENFAKQQGAFFQSCKAATQKHYKQLVNHLNIALANHGTNLELVHDSVFNQIMRSPDHGLSNAKPVPVDNAHVPKRWLAPDNADHFIHLFHAIAEFLQGVCVISDDEVLKNAMAPLGLDGAGTPTHVLTQFYEKNQQLFKDINEGPPKEISYHELTPAQDKIAYEENGPLDLSRMLHNTAGAALAFKPTPEHDMRNFIGYFGIQGLFSDACSDLLMCRHEVENPDDIVGFLRDHFDNQSSSSNNWYGINHNEPSQTGETVPLQVIKPVPQLPGQDDNEF